MASLGEIRECPFCGERGRLDSHELNGTEYFIIGCHTRGCAGSTDGRTVAMPQDDAARFLESWNTRKSPKAAKKKASHPCRQCGQEMMAIASGKRCCINAAHCRLFMEVFSDG